MTAHCRKHVSDHQQTQSSKSREAWGFHKTKLSEQESGSSHWKWLVKMKSHLGKQSIQQESPSCSQPRSCRNVQQGGLQLQQIHWSLKHTPPHQPTENSLAWAAKKQWGRHQSWVSRTMQGLIIWRGHKFLMRSLLLKWRKQNTVQLILFSEIQSIIHLIHIYKISSELLCWKKKRTKGSVFQYKEIQAWLVITHINAIITI